MTPKVCLTLGPTTSFAGRKQWQDQGSGCLTSSFQRKGTQNSDLTVTYPTCQHHVGVEDNLGIKEVTNSRTRNVSVRVIPLRQIH